MGYELLPCLGMLLLLLLYHVLLHWIIIVIVSFQLCDFAILIPQEFPLSFRQFVRFLFLFICCLLLSFPAVVWRQHQSLQLFKVIFKAHAIHCPLALSLVLCMIDSYC